MDQTFLKNRLHVLVSLFLVLATCTVYWQMRNHDFVDYDDTEYVTQNLPVQGGLTSDGIIWAFTTGHSANWHPLTWISHMLDIELYGLNAPGHHITSLHLHVASTLLLFYVFKRMTGALWQSAFVAALFALHPLHVESVAWVAERKDVLSGLFWILSLWAYVRYVEQQTWKRYVPIVFFLALGLMSKAMLVTLPLVFLLLDYWPFGRFRMEASEIRTRQKGRRGNKRRTWIAPALRLLWEKIPLFALVLASSLVTYFVQQSAGAFKYSSNFPLRLRIDNALISYVSYLGKTVWPSDLAVLYPHRAMSVGWEITMLPGQQVVLAAFLLFGLSVLFVRSFRRHPYLTVGWLWYVGTLVPVIGIVQVGTQAMADRYTYIPHIGLFIMIAWTVPALLKKWQRARAILVVSASLVVVGLGIVAWKQVGYWENNITLFEHTISATSNNPVAHYNLGYTLQVKGRYAEAEPHYAEALRLAPSYREAHYNLVSVLTSQGKYAEAAQAHNERSVTLQRLGNTNEAITVLLEAVRLKPDLAEAHFRLGKIFYGMRRYQEAVSHLSEAVRLDPKLDEAQNLLSLAQQVLTGSR